MQVSCQKILAEDHIINSQNETLSVMGQRSLMHARGRLFFFWNMENVCFNGSLPAVLDVYLGMEILQVIQISTDGASRKYRRYTGGRVFVTYFTQIILG